MTLMNAVMCDAISEDIGSVSLREVELPEPGPGEVRVRLKACAVNFPDLLMIQGKYQFKPPLPFAPGGEAAGDVEACGRVSALKKAMRLLSVCVMAAKRWWWLSLNSRYPRAWTTPRQRVIKPRI